MSAWKPSKRWIEIGGPKTVDALVEAARDNDPEMQIRATDGLVNVYLPGYLKTGSAAAFRGPAVRSARSSAIPTIRSSMPYVQVPPAVISGSGQRLARGGASLDARANAARAVGILRGRPPSRI